MSEMMTTFFPSLLLMLITYATTFFKPIFFEAALSVNLTTMLVMTTIFISKMESLPSTSDIKMIDMWLILCQLVPFAEVVILTAIEFFRDEAHAEPKHTNIEEVSDLKLMIGKIQVDTESETKPSNAWTDAPRQTSSISLFTILTAIGTFSLFI